MIAPGSILVGFSGSSGVLGRIIRWFTGGDVNHAFLLYQDAETRGPVVLGADSNGWVETPAESLRANSVVRLYDPPPGVDLRDGLAAMRERLGAGYDVGGLLGMTWVMICRRLFGRRVSNPFNANRKLFCSEAVDMVLDGSGVALGLDEHAIDPAELEGALRTYSGPVGSFFGPLSLEDVLGPSFALVPPALPEPVEIPDAELVTEKTEPGPDSGGG